MPRLASRLGALLGALALGIVLVPPAAAHVRLQASAPDPGATVTAPLQEVWLRFSGAVVPAYTRASLIGPDGTLIAAADLEEVPETGRREFRLPIDRRLWPGAYTVRWETLAADGHRMDGSFSFTLEVPEELLPLQPIEPEALEHPEVLEPERLRAEGPLAATIRLLHYLALLVLIGGVAFHLGVARRVARDGRIAAQAPEVVSGILRSLAVGLVLLLVVVVARLWAQSAQLYGFAGAWDAENLRTMLTVTIWGHAWLLQVALAVAFLLGLLVVGRRRTSGAGWALLTLAAAGLAVVVALTGHAVAVEGLTGLAVAVHALHVLGACIWLGGLAMLLVVGLPVVARIPAAERMPAVAALVSLFSPVALAGAALAATTGVLNALFHFGAFTELWTTDYGQTLLVKLALVLVAFGLGFYHWRVVLPRLAEARSAGGFSGTARGELAAGLAILGVTALLAAIPPPG